MHFNKSKLSTDKKVQRASLEIAFLFWLRSTEVQQALAAQAWHRLDVPRMLLADLLLEEQLYAKNGIESPNICGPTER